MSAGDRHARSRFQSGLLTWLRAAAPQDHANGLREMIAVTRALAADGADSGADGLLWRSAGSFLQALLDGSLATDEEARALCRRLERHLAIRPEGERRDDANSLGDAIFAYVSSRAPAPAAAMAGADGREASLGKLLGDTLNATADLLPLLGNAETRRFDDAQLQRWATAVGALRHAWHAVQTGAGTDCRSAATALLQVALELADPAALRLAEAFAEAGGAAEDRTLRALPGFRAAFTAALEVAEHPDGPDQKGFANNAAALADRLVAAATPPKAGSGLVCASAPWFVEDARETLHELSAALDAVPPKRLALLAGFDWFVQHETGKAMAICGLATTAHRIVGQVRADDLDQADTHAIIGRCIEALWRAVGELADGIPPHPDETVFAEVRALATKVRAQRQQAIAAARAGGDTAAVSPISEPPLQ